ncbi:hypothetical protein CBR_g8454 [Chara braunii]|uniref:FAD dependent oxidoreductase domain-containing protein n=1 Tax=Chara braunii TaxID=69332 RepID=A0A388KM82_CHABU|nr:hypothetical protein CBR_g8454 [Chara braunii]|eukprot:GBG71152.1 hypothetical protein CBR_g8454 [Chara braunii]
MALNTISSTTYCHNRCGFYGGVEFYIKGILDIGISPVKLLEILKNRFLAAGGVLLEQKELLKATSFDDGVVISISGQEPLVTRLLIDAMGHASPIVRQADHRTPGIPKVKQD